jgi:hypothetical protein
MAKDTAEPGGRSDLRSRLRVPQDGPVDLAAYGTGRTPGAPGGKKETRAETAAMRERIAGLQERLFAQSTAGDPRCPPAAFDVAANRRALLAT